MLLATCLTGSPVEVRQRLAALETVGLNQVMVLPNYDTRDDVLVDIARHLIGTES